MKTLASCLSWCDECKMASDTNDCACQWVGVASSMLLKQRHRRDQRRAQVRLDTFRMFPKCQIRSTTLHGEYLMTEASERFNRCGLLLPEVEQNRRRSAERWRFQGDTVKLELSRTRLVSRNSLLGDNLATAPYASQIAELGI